MKSKERPTIELSEDDLAQIPPTKNPDGDVRRVLHAVANVVNEIRDQQTRECREARKFREAIRDDIGWLRTEIRSLHEARVDLENRVTDLEARVTDLESKRL